MKLFAKIFALATTMFLFISSIPVGLSDQPSADNPRSGLPAELRQIMDENRERFFPPFHPDLGDTVTSFVKLNLDEGEHIRIFEVLRQVRIRQTEGRDTPALWRVFGTADLSVLLTHEQAREEIMFLFDLLRHGYDGYLYFGGDQVFLPIRDAMLESLAAMAEPLPVFSFLYGLLVPALRGVVADNHFWIHRTRFGPPAHVPYMDGEFVLHRDEGDFVTEIDGIMHRVIDVVGLPSPSVDGILPTLTAEGELAWAFGLVRAASQWNTMEIAVLLENIVTGESLSRTVNLQRVDSPGLQHGPVITKHEMEGIAVLENRSLLNLSPKEDDIFLRSGYELRDMPILVMDLRGHIGGNISFPRRWVGSYTRQEPHFNSLFATSTLLRSQVASELLHFFVPLQVSMLVDTAWEAFRAMDPRFATIEELGSPMSERRPLMASVPGTHPRVPIPNKNLVIVLTDGNIASAGELFVGHLRQLENVMVVGTNTSGTFLTSDVGRTMLPHSGLSVMFGTRLNLRHDLSQFEGVGFMPDLWVPPGESLERVLRFIERYGLAR